MHTCHPHTPFNSQSAFCAPLCAHLLPCMCLANQCLPQRSLLWGSHLGDGPQGLPHRHACHLATKHPSCIATFLAPLPTPPGPRFPRSLTSSTPARLWLCRTCTRGPPHGQGASRRAATRAGGIIQWLFRLPWRATRLCILHQCLACHRPCHRPCRRPCQGCTMRLLCPRAASCNECVLSPL